MIGRRLALTLPALLRGVGYDTACIGKWHLGWDWNAIRRPGTPPDSIAVGDFDWTRPIPGGRKSRCAWWCPSRPAAPPM